MINLEHDPVFGEVKERLNRLGIKGILFDLDDTLIYTSEIFVRFMEEYAALVSEKIGVDQAEIMMALQSINDDEYKKMGVNPKRWAAVVEKLAKQFENGEQEIIDNLDILMKIYTVEPRVREGVTGILEILGKTGVKLALVTHANVEWTNFKLDRLGLWNHFETVVIVDENGHKKSVDWKKGMDALELDPDKCLVVGDSLGGDIKPGDELGAKTIYMPSPWSVYREGEVPEKTVMINEISELLAALGKLG